MRNILGVEQLASGHEFRIPMFPNEGDQLTIEICNKDTSAMISKISINKADISDGYEIDLDAQDFENKLEVNKEYIAKFYAEANNESVTKPELFNYIRKKVSSLAKPNNLKFSDVKSADGLVTIGQKLTWDAVNSDGVENITYSVYKDNVLLHEGNSLAEYTIEKGSATAPTERNGNYQVKAFGKSNGITVTSDLSDTISLSWFIQLDTPVITLAEDGKTISWDAIENAASYKLFMGSNIYTTKNLSYIASTKGDYIVKAIPSNNNSYRYFISEASNSVTVTEESLHVHSPSSTWSADSTGHWHECTSCGQELDKSNHSYEINYSGDKHWMECTVCHYKTDEEAHQWNVLPSMDSIGTCQICSAEDDHMPIPSTGVNYAQYSDSEHHAIYICDTCHGLVQKLQSHDTDGFNGTCSKCGYEPVVACQHPNKTLTNTGDHSEHQWSCPDCGESGIENHDMKPYAVANCQYGNQLKCACGFIDDDGQIDENNHAAPPTTEYTIFTDSNNHAVYERCQACTGHYIRTEPHTFGAWTETNNGDYERECSCGETQTCDHSKITLSQLNETEHTVSCTNCPASWTESHTFNDNGLCECGYQCQHPAKNYLYNSNNNGTHSITCGKCGATVEAAATCVDDKNPRGTCDVCGGPMV